MEKHESALHSFECRAQSHIPFNAASQRSAFIVSTR